jgi:dTDP-4-amino-4,6-dideoxygalactose transaminase
VRRVRRRRAATLLREELDACDVLLTTSCTAALEMSALLLGIRPGDTVVVPSFGFVTTALAFARAGARMLFCDIEERTLGLDPSRLADIMDDSVRAVVPIHYAGVGCDIEDIHRVLDRWPRAELVEDNAHGLYGRYRDRPLGSFGRFSTLSFHETKNFICGEFVPLHDSPGGRRFAARHAACPASERISARLLRLPFYTDITDAEAEEVIGRFGSKRGVSVG